ncbi:MAG: hypothetical protein ACI8P0_005222 [Planctomycetaceae bacterium]|jgi:hypothetical protein
MRNLTVAYEVAGANDIEAGFVVIYADAPTLPMAQLVGSERWDNFVEHIRRDAIAFDVISYQRLIEQATATVERIDGDGGIWRDLTEWVTKKITIAASVTRD